MTCWICKICGRAIRAEEKPNFCYFDRTMAIENIGDEDAVKMGLFSTTEGTCLTDFENHRSFIVEFDRDLIYDPFSGEKARKIMNPNHSLYDFQNMVMRRVIKDE